MPVKGYFHLFGHNLFSDLFSLPTSSALIQLFNDGVMLLQKLSCFLLVLATARQRTVHLEFQLVRRPRISDRVESRVNGSVRIRLRLPRISFLLIDMS